MQKKIDNPQFGMMAPMMNAHTGRRTHLVHPAGLEKRVTEPLMKLARITNARDGDGLRLAVSDGIPYTEINAFHDLFAVQAYLIGAGGTGGYEGSCLFLLEEEKENIQLAAEFADENNNLKPYAI